MAFSPRTTSLTVVRPRAQKPADERFFEKLEAEVGSAATLHCQSHAEQATPERSSSLGAHPECPVSLAAWKVHGIEQAGWEQAPW